MAGTILITSVKELFDDLDLHLNEAMTFWVVRTACSHGNPHLSVNCMSSLLVNWVPLSQIISSGVPSTEKQKLRAEITSLEML